MASRSPKGGSKKEDRGPSAEALRERVRRLERALAEEVSLSDIQRRLLASVDLEQVATTLLEMAPELTACERCRLSVRLPEGDWECWDRPLGEPIERYRLGPESGFPTEVSVGEDLVCFPWGDSRDRQVELSKRVKLRSYVALPVVAPRRQVGIFEAANFVHPEEIESHAEILGEMLTSAAVAIERKQAEVERERLLAEIQRRAAELDATVNSIADGVIIYGQTGEVVRMNRAAERMLGLPLEQLRLPPEEQLKHLRIETPGGSPLPAEESPARQAAQGKTVRGFVMILHPPDGKAVWVANSAAPIRTLDRRIVGAVITLTDITELHELQEQREDLIRMVSHDLRSPLTAVQGQAQLLLRLMERTGQDGQLRQSAGAIYTSARRMNVMIQDLVDMARVESRQLRLNRKRVDLRAFVLELKQRMAVALDTDRVQLEVPAELPPVWADPDRLERVLTNLLSNALKYSQGGVRVASEKSDGELTISVIDQGTGIPAEDLPHLFERFYRAKGTRKAEGLGLGLYITRMLVEAMGGQIWVTSKPGEGSTFSFTLPLAADGR